MAGEKNYFLNELRKAERRGDTEAVAYWQAQIDRLTKFRGDFAAGVATLPGTLPEDYTVRQGDSPASIAKMLYGDERAMFDIIAANPDVFKYDPSTGTYTTIIHPGQTLNIPQGKVGEANVPSNVGFIEASGDVKFFGTTPGTDITIPGAISPEQVAITQATDEVTRAFRSQEAAFVPGQGTPGGVFTPDQLAPAPRATLAPHGTLGLGTEMTATQKPMSATALENALNTASGGIVPPAQTTRTPTLPGLGIGADISRAFPQLKVAPDLQDVSLFGVGRPIITPPAAPPTDQAAQIGAETNKAISAFENADAQQDRTLYPLFLDNAVIVGVANYFEYSSVQVFANKNGYVQESPDMWRKVDEVGLSVGAFTPGAFFTVPRSSYRAGKVRGRSRRGSRGRKSVSGQTAGYNNGLSRWNVTFS